MTDTLSIVKQILILCEEFRRDYETKDLIPDEFRRIRIFFRTLDFYLSGNNPKIRDMSPEIITRGLRETEGFNFNPNWKWKPWKNATPGEKQKINEREVEFKHLYASLNWE